MDTIHAANGRTIVEGAPARSESSANCVTDSNRLGFAEVADDALAEHDGATAETTEKSRVGRSGPDRPESADFGPSWVLLAPPLGGVILWSISAAVDPNPLRTGTSPAGLLAFAVLIPFFLVCVAGTVTLYRDVARLRATATDWSPNPWRYLVPSAVALVVVRAFPFVQRAGRIEGAVGFLVGTFVVALAASSILAGPAYLFQRRRRLCRGA